MIYWASGTITLSSTEIVAWVLISLKAPQFHREITARFGVDLSHSHHASRSPTLCPSDSQGGVSAFWELFSLGAGPEPAKSPSKLFERAQASYMPQDKARSSQETVEMPLKRGLERGSCDFCFRRKIKCDRQIRATQGFHTCSPCNVRGGQCRLDDSDDIRIRRRQTAGPRGDGAVIILNAPQELSSQTRGDNQAHHTGPFTQTSHPVIAVPASYDLSLIHI